MKLPFGYICDLFEVLSEQQGKDSVKTKKDFLTDFFLFCLNLFPGELPDLYRFICLRTDLEWLQLDLGVGIELIQKVVKTVTGKSVTSMREDFRSIGDYGSVFEKSQKGQNSLMQFFGNAQKKQEEKQLVLFQYVFQQIKELSQITGDKSKQLKEELLVQLLRLMTSVEGKYLI